MKYQLVVFVPILIASFGCNSSLEKRVAKKADECENENCKIKLVDFTDFQWDKMYVFNYSVSPEEVDAAIGMNYSNYEEFTRPWIFVKNNKVVYAENNPDGIESAIEGEIAFDQPDSLRFMSYTPVTAVFKAKKERSDGNKYHVLYQVK